LNGEVLNEIKLCEVSKSELKPRKSKHLWGVNLNYITAETVMDFLRLLKEKYSDKPVFLVPVNAKYQHCRAIMKKAANMVLPYYFYRLIIRTLIS
jgi:hypothetical protein